MGNPGLGAAAGRGAGLSLRFVGFARQSRLGVRLWLRRGDGDGPGID